MVSSIKRLICCKVELISSHKIRIYSRYLILLHLLTDSLKEAVDYHDKAKSLAPDSASVGWNEVRLLLKRNDVSKAVVTARKSINKRFQTISKEWGF